ncbi:hypothetical protein SBBP2_730018 [Burkholderiales bacterium]|nr:hypothetical protein SBBP2_730018 [Burkholderiales bacterium]
MFVLHARLTSAFPTIPTKTTDFLRQGTTPHGAPRVQNFEPAFLFALIHPISQVSHASCSQSGLVRRLSADKSIFVAPRQRTQLTIACNPKGSDGDRYVPLGT